jgi:hypothetical protein
MLGCSNHRLARPGRQAAFRQRVAVRDGDKFQRSQRIAASRRWFDATLRSHCSALLAIVNRAGKCVVVTPNRIIGSHSAQRRPRISVHVLRRRSCGSTYLSFCCSACRRGVVVKHRVDYLAGRDLALDGIEKADEFDGRWRCMQRPITVPSSTLSVANSVVVPCRL